MSPRQIKRVLNAVAVVFGCTLVIFVILRLSGDPVSLMLSDPSVTPEDYERMSKALGLDKPIHIQYFIFLKRMLMGDFGTSYKYGMPAMEVALARVPATIELTLLAMVMVVLVGIPLGVLAATRKGRIADHVVSITTLLGQAMPNYWVGIMFILVLSVQFRLLPTSGRGGLRYLIMPVIVLALHPVSKVARLTRSELLEVLSLDYIRTARSKGMRERTVLLRHALRNAMLVLVTIIGMDTAYLLGGAVVTETVFAWPGIGKLLVDAISSRDFPVIQACTFLITIAVVVINVTVDFCYSLLDPRMRKN